MLKQSDKPMNQASRTFVTIGELVSTAFEDERTSRKASAVLRGTYLKKEYSSVWPRGMLHRVTRECAGGPKPKKFEYQFPVSKQSRCFVRNLWALDQFFGKPSEVLAFLQGKPEETKKLFCQRCEELRVLEQIYRRWPAEQERVERLLPDFDPLRTDLYALISSPEKKTKPEATTTIKVETVVVEVSPAIADQIRRLEQRSSYREGDPVAMIEKALCYLELGCKEIAQRIASEALQEHPNHPAVLYGNAVLLLVARRANLALAFQHELMHPAGLVPITSEEHWHHDRQMAEVSQAMQRESDAFGLLVRALEKWPIDLPNYSSAMHPVSWRQQAEQVVLQMGADRVLGPSYRAGEGIDGKNELTESLRACVVEIVKELPRLLFLARDLKPLLHLLVISSRIAPKTGRACLDWIRVELGAGMGTGRRSKRLTSGEAILLGLPTIAESLAELLNEREFIEALIALVGAEKSLQMCQLIETRSAEERTRRITRGHFSALSAMVRGSDYRREMLEESLAVCMKMESDPHLQGAGLASPKQKHWRYAIIRLQLECSWAAFIANDTSKATQFASEALKRALEWFTDVAGKAPMVIFESSSDDYGDESFEGDWLRAEPNIITGRNIIIQLPAIGNDLSHRYFSKWTPAKPPEEFAIWAATNDMRKTPLLLAYATWLVERVPKAKLMKSRLKKLKALLIQ